MTRPRRRALAAVLGVVVALAAAEGLLRLTRVGIYAARTGTFVFVTNPEKTYWTVNPEVPAKHRWDGDPYGHLPPGAQMDYEINGMGMRGPLPPPGRRTVLVMGDSFTFGEGVPLEDTFVARLGRRLGGEPAKLSFANAGVAAFGTGTEAAYLPRMLDRFSPGATLLVLVPNDAIPFQGTTYMGNALVLDTSEVPPPLYLGELVRRVAGRRARNEWMENWYLSYYTGEQRAHWDTARARLEAMAQAARARQSKFAVVYFPLLYRLGDDPLGAIRDEVSAACTRMGVPFLDLTPALAVESDNALAVHPTDRHPSRRAHELAAEAMAPFVEQLMR